MSAMALGWQLVPPTDPPLSPLFDTPPTSGDPTAQRTWRSTVERDQRQLAARHARQPVWYPVLSTETAHVVPVYGGTPDMWRTLLACVAASPTSRGVDRVRMVNLVHADVFDLVRGVANAGRTITVRSDLLSAHGSTFDVFARLSTAELTGLVADVLRQDPGEARRARRELARVATLLAGPVDVARLCDAVAIVLGRNRQTVSSPFTPQEERQLRDHRADVVAQQSPVAALLSELHSELEELVEYRHDRARPPGRFGGAGQSVRTLAVDYGGGIQDRRLACELLARAAARSFGAAGAETQLLVVVGAEFLATEVLQALTGAAQRDGKQLMLLFGRITEDAHSTLGHAGADTAVFLRLSNANDATKAADHLGRQFTFVVNGISIAEGSTDQWTRTEGTSSTTTTGTSRTSTGNRSLGLKGALSVGHSFGRTLSDSFTAGTSSSTTTGGSQQTTSTTNFGRVHEHVLPPEVFQQLADDVMLVVRRSTVVFAHCDLAITTSGLVSATPWGP